MKKRGFTLIELVVVIALIAILAVTLAPRLRDQIAKGRDAKSIAALGALRTSAEVYFADYGQDLVTAGTDNGGALTLAMDGISPASQKLFTNAAGTADFVSGTIVRTGTYPTVASGAASTTLFVPVGGHRAAAGTDSSNTLSFGGTITFAVQTDGIDIEFALPSTDPIGGYDTKGADWTKY